MIMRRFVLLCAFVLAAGVSAQGPKLGQTPPEIENPKATWFNTNGKALSLKALKGRPIWLEFGFIN